MYGHWSLCFLSLVVSWCFDSFLKYLEPRKEKKFEKKIILLLFQIGFVLGHFSKAWPGRLLP